MLGRWLITPWPGLIYSAGIQWAAWTGNSRAQAMRHARQSAAPNGPFDLIIHCASLGEYWMIQPLVHQWHKEGQRLLITLFSTSGEPVRQDAPCAVTYLPMDRPRAIKTFLNQTQPRAVLFVKYDLWPVFTAHLRRRDIPYGLALAHTPRGHRWVRRGSLISRPGLKNLAFCAQQTAAGAQAWRSAGLGEAAVAGDGRVDAVRQRAAQWQPIKGMEDFLDGRNLIILGSAWDDEVNMMLPLILKFPKVQVVIAPHDVSKAEAIAAKLPVSYVKWSNWTPGEHLREARVLIVDTVGDLFQIYGHGDMALVGGAFGPGLHNILEPLAFGLPVSFGPKLDQHWEAQAAIEAGIGHVVRDSTSLQKWIEAEMRQNRHDAIEAFMTHHSGAMSRLNQLVQMHLFQ